MKTIAFILSMPNVGSWNGKWTGEGNLYAVVKKFTDRWFEKNKHKFMNGGYYNFGDGWGASIDCKEVCSDEARLIRRRSKGFCGYEWMIDSLIWEGEILNTEERLKKLREKESESLK